MPVKAKGFARTNFRKLKPDIRRPRAAATSYEPGAMPAAYGMPVGLAVKPGTIVIFELGGKFYPNDVQLWASKSGLPAPKIKTYMLVGADDSAGDADGEVALDWQKAAEFWSYMTGTAAEILIVYGQNSGATFADCINYANTLSNIYAGSWSWGQEEDQWIAADLGSTSAATYSALYPITAASGDNDADDGASIPTVDAPACIPYIVAAGGTSFPPGGMEVVWNNGGSEGTGGGFSKIYNQPTWQPSDKQGKGRMVPDMAINADPNTGHNVVINGEWGVIGGTSAVAPMMAGVLAVVNGIRAYNNLSPISGAAINSQLWNNPSSFYDITNGNNYSSGKGTGYVATVGPDPCTGLGRPLATLVSVLSSSTAVPPPVSPPPVSPPPVSPPPPPSPPPSGGVDLAAVIAEIEAVCATLETELKGVPFGPQLVAYVEKYIILALEEKFPQVVRSRTINWGPILQGLEPILLQLLGQLIGGQAAGLDAHISTKLTFSQLWAYIQALIAKDGPAALPLVILAINASSLPAPFKQALVALVTALLSGNSGTVTGS